MLSTPLLFPGKSFPALKIHELAPHHTITPGDRGFYTSVFVYAMNKQKYESLPDELKKVIDDNSGMAMSKLSGKQWDIAEIEGRKPADARANTIVEMVPAEIDKLRDGTKIITDQWISDMGSEGQALYDAANQLIDQYDQQ